MDKFLIASKNNNVTRFILLIAFGFLIKMMDLVLSEAFKNMYFELFYILPLSIILLLTSLTLYILLHYFPKIIINEKEIQIKNYYGLYKKTILLEDINIIDLKDKVADDYSFQECIITYNDTKKYKINSFAYQNYNEIKKILPRKGMRHNYLNELSKQERFKKEKRIILYLVGFVILLFSTKTLYDAFGVDTKNITEVTLTIKENSYQDNGDIYFLAQEYPNFGFKIDSDIAKIIKNKEKLLHTEGGQKIYFLLNEDEYKSKLAFDKIPNFWQKHVNYYTINIYGASDNFYTYFTLDNYKRIQNNNIDNGIIYIILLCAIFVSIVLFYKEKQKTKRKKRNKI